MSGLAVLSLTGGVACTAGVRPSATGTGGNAGSASTGSGGTAGTTSGPGLGGTGGDVILTGVGGSNPDASACQQKEVMFAVLNPTVYLLVDRSGSMFHCLTGDTGSAVCGDMTNTSWSNLKNAIEAVLPQLDSQVRFGFTTIYGTNPVGGGMCPSLQGTLTDKVAPALNNAGTIATLYDSLPFPPNSTQMGIKLESPISESLGNVTQALMADTGTGKKYIIFITDGQPDYCDDSNGLCAPDSVVWQLQKAKTAGISTIVFGIQTTAFPLAPGVLQAFANAGAGEPTLAPVTAGLDKFAFYDQCDGVAGWAADLAASAQTPARGVTLGTYSTTMGPTMPYSPNATDQTQLVSQLKMALSGVRSCTYDLPGFTINTSDPTELNGANVYLIDGAGNHVPLPYDSTNTNGWDMTTPTQLQFYGPACDQVRDMTTMGVKFNFPCKIVICVDNCPTP